MGGHLTREPWRKVPNYTEKELNGKLKLVLPATKLENNPTANILLLGALGSGKSSYVNSILSLIERRIVNEAYTQSDTDTTLKLHQHKDTSGKMRLLDCMGMGDGLCQGIHEEDIYHLINGNINIGYEFHRDDPISRDNPLFVSDPEDKDKVHCVILFHNGNSGFDCDLLVDLRKMRRTLKKRGIPTLLVITNIDKLCEYVYHDASVTFRSYKVKELVEQVAEVIGMPKGHIHPIKNYEEEVMTDIAMDNLLMIPLMQSLDFCSDYLKLCKNKNK